MRSVVASVVLLVTSLVVAGCSCAGASNGNCALPCGDAESACPAGSQCVNACCVCAPADEICDGVDQSCNGLIDDGLEDSCACAPGGPGASEEVCNGVDDDCNGAIDDGVPTGDEVCNGVDDDCDGTIDDGLDACACAPDGAGRSAEICNGVDDDCNGVIDDGTMQCGGRSMCACAPDGPGPSDERCNGADDDCDGAVDEDLAGCACTMCGASAAEVCNMLDDDCDGAIDDGLDATTCPCVDGGPGPSVETCNGVDDDCDGAIDDGLEDTCACAPGGPGPSAEICNGVDDDCDGVIDGGVDACACAPGGPGPSTEVCDGVDDDCDGMIDEVSATGGTCGAFGDPCTRNSDCSTELCTGDAFEMYCTRPCAMAGMDPGDCPSGYRCWDDPSTGGTDLCRRDYAPCERDADCAPGEVCAPTCDDLGTGVVTECRPAIAGGGDAPAACTRHDDCASDSCFRTHICTEVCGSDADCAPGYRCVLLQYPGCGGGGYVPRCLDACDCDTECPSGQLCQPFVHQVIAPDTATTVGACDIAYGPLAPGADCDNSMGMFCAHAICSAGGTGSCTQVCSAMCGCPSGIGPCGASTVTFPNLGSYPAMTCAAP